MLSFRARKGGAWAWRLRDVPARDLSLVVSMVRRPAPCPGLGESLERRRERYGCKVSMANALCVVNVRPNGE